ncbi:hypothetical protein LV164_001330 [Aspergillus fumigatus]|nr:hypothetical protein KXX42_003534 [Aspergillus fumigatus]KAH1551317.1 hypothetical protein KXX57_008739 [Aspergillus fumigatus]KAH1987140.1 hypothetical protein KXW88_004333 [Aspergillus fumigatus]KAH2167859.1 hypothetical protein KXV74_002781 [Aspergillus fumigatus]KAH2312576.1 hypothetical protein KXV47_003767 [Aspergillus fumigatus]
MGKAALQDPHGGIWYFAYGSNLRLSVLENRGIKALDIKAVIVPSHYLTFDIFGIPYAEPSFASVAPFAPEKKTTLRLGDSPASRDVPPVQGLAYLLNPRDYRQLVISEGGGVAYDEVEVHASILDKDGKPDPGATLIARTLQAKYPWRPNGAPSARYLGLISTGCKQNEPLTAYSDYIDSLPAYEPPTSLHAKVGGLLFLMFWRPPLRLLIRLIRVNTDQDGHCPQWLGWIILTLYGLMWSYHDNIHSKIWGRGDGRKLHFEETPAKEAPARH